MKELIERLEEQALKVEKMWRASVADDRKLKESESKLQALISLLKEDDKEAVAAFIEKHGRKEIKGW